MSAHDHHQRNHRTCVVLRRHGFGGVDLMEIRTLKDGEKITEPGAYKMPMATYHSQCCPGPSVSSSGLRTIAHKSPLHFWDQSELNPDAELREPSDSLILGQATHALVLGDEEFDEQFIFVPDDAPPRPTKTQIAAFERDGEWSEKAAPGAKFWEEFDARADGRMLLKAEQVAKIQRMAENLAKTPEAVAALTGPLAEISMIWQDEATGIWVKSRPDMIPGNGADFSDLKTFAPKTSHPKLAVQRAITDHAYADQMALAVEGCERVLGGTASDCRLIFVQTTPPYVVIPVRLDEEALYWGRVHNRHALDTMARCLESGEWPGPITGFMDYTTPPSLAHRYGELQLDGDLPNIERSAA